MSDHAWSFASRVLSVAGTAWKKIADKSSGKHAGCKALTGGKKTDLLSCQKSCETHHQIHQAAGTGCNTINFKSGECNLKKCGACTVKNCEFSRKWGGFDVYTTLSQTKGVGMPRARCTLP